MPVELCMGIRSTTNRPKIMFFVLSQPCGVELLVLSLFRWSFFLFLFVVSLDCGCPTHGLDYTVWFRMPRTPACKRRFTDGGREGGRDGVLLLGCFLRQSKLACSLNSVFSPVEVHYRATVVV